jgi:hypothetical protein
MAAPQVSGRAVALSRPRSAAKPACRAATCAATSPATGPGPRLASQLYNAKDPLTLFELQAWLGHRTRQPPSTPPEKISPNTLSKAYTEADYFARNVRTIEVLIDRERFDRRALNRTLAGLTATNATNRSVT